MTLNKLKISDEIIKELSDREKKIVGYIKKEGEISRSECVELLDVSSATAYRDLKSLEEEGGFSLFQRQRRYRHHRSQDFPLWSNEGKLKEQDTVKIIDTKELVELFGEH